MAEERNQNLRERKKPLKTEEKKSEPKKPPTQTEDVKEPVFGPMPTFPHQRFWARMLLVLGTIVVVYFTSANEKVVHFAKQKEKLNHRRQEIPCSEDYLKEVSQLLGWKETVRCGRLVMDSLVSPAEAEELADLARRGLSLTGEPAGGASILDLHTGALSAGKGFINLYALNVSLFNSKDYSLYTRVRRKIHDAVAFSFNLPADKIFLTKPTFFSRLTAKEPATPHDEYWHTHVDKETYESFHYTSLLYLNDFKVDFEGGRFIFDDLQNVTTVVEPRKGRVLMFSSGRENPHRVERVTRGERLAITVSFTCDLTRAIPDPSISKFSPSS